MGLLVAFCTAASWAARADVAYHWPLDLPCVLTSSFAEYRVGRFHAGIDLRTGGIGRDVHAAEDGYVSRVRCSPWGYGKAVYLQLEDGYTVVYGHLDGFAEPLAEYVRRAQHARKSYTVDLYPEAGMFPVARGAVIAKSGRTGTGAPHLHYEIRDPAGRPINPRRLGISWPDTTRPVIRKVLIAPAGPNASLNGDIVPLVREVRATGPGQYTCDPVFAYGRIGFGLDVIDPANNSANKLGVYTVSTTAAGKEIFRIQNDRLSYDTNHNGDVSFHPFFLAEGRFLLQWRWPGNRCEPFQQVSSEGWYSIPEEPVDVRVETQDFLGNTAVVTIPLRPDIPLPLAGPTQGGTGTGKVELECLGNWLLLTARFSKPETETPDLMLDGPATVEGGRFHRVSAKTFRAGYLPAEGTREAVLRVQHDRIAPYERRLFVFQRGAGERTAALDGALVRVQSNSPYGTLFIRGCESGGEVASRIRVLGKPYRLWPDAAPIDVPVEIAFPIPEGVEQLQRVHVYRKKAPRGWSCERTRRTGDRLTIATRRLGTFAVMEDDQPPQIANITPAQGAHVTTARPAVRATVTDHGSGVKDITVTCNGQWLLMKYDPERNLIEWARDEDLPPGPKELLFSVSDEAGNTTTRRRTIAGP